MHLIVPFDFSLQSERALALALQGYPLAKEDESRVEVFHVIDEELYRRLVGKHGTPGDTAVYSYLEEYVDRLHAQLGMEARAAHDLRVARGKVLPALIERINRLRPDAVMIGGQGHGGIKERVFGRTAQRVLRQCEVTTYVVRETQIDADDQRPILCAIDLGEGSAIALQRAAAMAEHYRRPLEVVSVIEVASAPYFEWVQTHAAAATETTARELYDFEKRVLGEVRSVRRHVSVGTPPDIITRLATERGAGLIVLGSHRHSAVERALLGSTAENVAAHAPVDVLVVR